MYYVWQLALYLVFMAIFIGFGSAIGLKLFTKNNYGIQVGTPFLTHSSN